MMRNFAVLIALVVANGTEAGTDSVQVMRTPHGGIQPQAARDDKGTLHLIYFKGDAAAGDLFYVYRRTDQKDFSTPLRVNSQPGSAIAVGSIRGGQIAVGKNGRVHVAWNGSGKALPRGSGKYTAPMLYSRLNDAGTAFEEQRNLMHQTDALDGGGTVAADAHGSVYVAWHAGELGGSSGEDSRSVWLAVSSDDGKTFAKERPMNVQRTGACACCGMKGFVDSRRNSYLIYRTARDGNQRHMYLLTSADQAKTFSGKLVHPWEINSCPMSSESFAEGPDGVYVAWDTDGQVYFARIKQGTPEVGEPVAAPGAGKGRKHPALAINAKGEILLAWTEGTAWQRGGALTWQVFDKSGTPTSERGRVAGAIPVWGLPAAVVEPDGQFTVIH
jgi:hypothetical protein